MEKQEIDELKRILREKYNHDERWLAYADEETLLKEMESMRKSEETGIRYPVYGVQFNQYVSFGPFGTESYSVITALHDHGYSYEQIKAMGDIRAFELFCNLTKTPRPDFHLKRMARLEARERREAARKAELANNPKVVIFPIKQFRK